MAAAITAFIFPFAFLVGGLVNQIGRRLCCGSARPSWRSTPQSLVRFWSSRFVSRLDADSAGGEEPRSGVDVMTPAHFRVT